MCNIRLWLFHEMCDIGDDSDPVLVNLLAASQLAPYKARGKYLIISLESDTALGRERCFLQRLSCVPGYIA